ncbi:MAG: hypothetical protein COA79_22430 [Planctomycetota bacterium]|nr:MAG: hypothetical protein COA79_22430 [Planctomycetota bacterium]
MNIGSSILGSIKDLIVALILIGGVFSISFLELNIIIKSVLILAFTLLVIAIYFYLAQKYKKNNE